MVYRGPPAKGCERCRKRRIRCDLKAEECGNCKRAGAACSGYRKHIDLMFCDQTTDTAKKVANRGTPNWVRATKGSDSEEKKPSLLNKKSVKSHERDSRGGEREFPTGQSELPILGQALSSYSVDDFALLYCRNHHLVRLPEANECLNIIDEKLLCCLKALGAASYSTTIQSPQLAAQSRKYYVSAIQLLNRDLALPSEAVKDSALLTVITLSYYESVSGSSSRSLTAWSQHIQGISALIELRGPEQLETPEGRLLFHQATSCLVFDCLRMSIRLPFCIHDLVKLLANEVEDQNDPPWRLHLALIDLAELKADIFENTVGDPQDTIHRLVKIEEDLRATFCNVSSDWSYQVQPSGHRLFASCLPDYHHIYESAIAAQLRNSARNARIVCHALIACMLRHTASPITLEQTSCSLERCYTVMQQLQTEILASVPQHLGLDGAPSYKGYCPSVNEKSPQCPSKDLYRVAKTSSILPVLRTPHHYIFLWNLLLAGEVSPLGGPQRRAICEMLVYAGQSVGMAQAFVFAKALEQNQHAAASLGVRADGQPPTVRGGTSVM